MSTHPDDATPNHNQNLYVCPELADLIEQEIARIESRSAPDDEESAGGVAVDIEGDDLAGEAMSLPRVVTFRPVSDTQRQSAN